LTTREQLVLQLASEGATNADIANKLGISRRTVEMHRCKAMRKLNLHNQTELVRFAIRQGILQP
jgi:DNA-binding NarL/FixJ family response regulator